MTGTSY